MSEDLPLDEALQLEQRGYPLFGKSGVPVTRPTAAGLRWLAVPRDCVGLAYRIQGGTTLEAIAFAPDPQVRLRSLEITAPVVQLTCSADGRLVVAACIDGSLQCINATSTSLELRWIVRNAHSHIAQNVSAAVSSSRDFAASKSGPVQSLAFAPSGYALLLADAGYQTLSIYDAASLNPVNLVQNQTQVLCAAWSTETPSNGEYPLAVGCVDGSIDVMTFSMSSGDIENVYTISALEDEDKEGFVCTYLDWFDSGESLASGYCRVTPSDNNDEQGEDDSAEHEATLYVGPVDNYEDRTEVGDVVPFFSVPRNGRHVFFSSFCPSNRDTPLLFVASNVASEIGVVAPDSGEWQVIDLQEGCGASAPTDEDDDFTFPMGIATVLLPDAGSTSYALLLASTDGSLSVFHITNQNNPDAFRIPQTSIVHGIACLPAEPLEMEDVSPPTPPLSPEPEEIASAQESDAPQEATPVFGSGSASGLSFGSGAPSSFGSPAFGQPSVLGDGRKSAFGSPAFGQPSTLGFGGSSVFGSPAAPFGPPSTPAPFGGGGGSAPIFGSATSSGGGFAALAASPAAGSGFGASLGQSPFDAFSKSSRSPADSVSSSMVRPLFGDIASIQTSPIKETVEGSTTTPVTEIPPIIEQPPPELVEEPATFDEPGAKKAALVFDSFDENKTGIVSLEEFEAMLDELGEGFHGEELEAQRALIDPKGTNQIGRSAFVLWYVKLLAGDDRSGADDDKSSLDSEQEEERAKADEVFASLATTGEAGKSAIAKDDFSKLMEAMGTTYCEEEHRKTVKKLTKSDGMIYGDDFTAWYLDWLFGEGDNDEESEDSDESRDNAEAGEAAGAGGEDAGGWGNMFGTSEDTWKCDSCMVRNNASANICVACETPKPGHAAPAAPALESSAPLGASIGAGGFTFGGAVPVAPASEKPSAVSAGLASSSAGGFTFVVASAPAAPASEPLIASRTASIGAGGFSLSGDALSPAAASSELSGCSLLASTGASGSTLGGGVAPGGGIWLGSSPVAKSATKATSLPTVSTSDSGLLLGAAKVEAKTKKDSEITVKPSKSSGYPPLSTKAPTPFGGGKISAPAPSKSVGSSAYPPMSSKAPVPFGRGSATSSKPSDEQTLFGSSTVGQPFALGGSTTPAHQVAFGKQGSSTPGSSTAFGSSTFTAAFGSGGQAPVVGPTGGGFGAFTASPAAGLGFGASLGPSPFGAFPKSSKSPTGSMPSSMVKPLFGDSMSQPSEVKETAEDLALELSTKRVLEEAPPELAGEPATFDEPGAKRAALVFDSFDEEKAGTLPLQRFEAILDELGEGFHGEELEAQRALIDPKGTNQIGRSAFVSWYVKLLAGDDRSGADGDKSSLDSEQEEERAKADEVFASLATTGEAGKSAIAKDDFSKLMEAMGTTYCEEEHRKTVKKLTKSDGMIYGDDFTAWYLDWLFGEGDNDEESEDSDESRDNAEAGEAAGAGGEDAGGWGNMFGTSEDTWKCDSCMVRNNASANICVSCETPKPGHAAPAEPALEPSVPLGASIGAGGFTFGGAAPVSPVSAQLSAISGQASSGAGGFTFGGASVPAAPAPSSALASIGAGGFTFGGGTAPAGGFSFGSSAFQKSDTKAASTSTTADSGFSLDTAKGAANNKEDTTESKAKATSESSRYPPLSSKTPTLFGAAKSSAPAPPKPAGSIYPPMSSKAPVPFGSGNGNAIGTTEPSGSLAYPPIPSKAPTPFAAAKTSAPAPAGPSYPPMSSKAPVLFGSGKDGAIGSTKPSGSSAYPPIPSKAPTPFAAAKTSAPAPAGPSYPPMSSKAPVPFGSGKDGAIGSTKPSGSSAYPPIPSKAPTPFAAAKTSAPAPAGPSYPPMPSKAPVPFGSGKASAIGSTKLHASSVCTPISSEAPTPFGAAKTITCAASKPVGASFPPRTSKAPTPFVTSSKEPVRQTPNTPMPSETRDLPSSSLPFLTPAASDYESQFRKVIVLFRASISLLADNRVLPDSLLSPAGLGSDFEGKIEKLVEESELVRTACSDSHKQMKNQKDRFIFLLSRKTDIQRQTDDARHLIDAHAVSVAQQYHIMQTEPLDAESERFRRRLAVKALMVTRDLERIENRISMTRGICDVRSDVLTRAPIAVSSQDRKNVLFEALLSNFHRTQLFKEEVAEIASTVQSYAATIPSMISHGTRSTPLSRARSPHTSISGRSSKHRLTPVPLRVSDNQLKSRSSSKPPSFEGREKWAKIEIAILKTKVKTVQPKKLTSIARSGSSSSKSVSIEQGRRTAAAKPSLFLSPARSESARRSILDDTERRELLTFSSPVSMPRSQWLASSDFDQARVKVMSMKFPDRLREVSATEAAREALAGFGTTPEKTERAIELRNSARTTEPSKSRTPAEKTPRGSTSSAAFPPMSAKAPTPFSMNTTDKLRDAKGSYPHPPIAKEASPLFSKTPSAPASMNAGQGRRTSTDAVSLQPESSFSLKDDKKSSEKAAESAFGSLKGLGDSLFAEESKTSERSEKIDFGVSGVNSGLRDATGGKPEPDYRAILTEFYMTHSPAKLIEVDKTLEKYEGREVEMFTKLARKYKVPNPLDSLANPSVSAPVIPAPMPSSSISSAFGSTLGSDPNTTPSFGVSKPQTFPSSFGGTMTKSNPLGPTFGEPPSTSTFGSMAPPASPSPFGRPSTQSTSSFGAAKQSLPLSSPSPFGPPATQSATSFGVTPQAAPPSSTAALISGREPREMLVAFYQKYNPSRLNEVDKVLIKYKNNEELLFRNLAKKYNLDPSLFGLRSNPQPSGFGSVGTGSTQGGFGQMTPLGESATSGFGSSLGSGQPTAAFGSPFGGSTFGSPSAVAGHAFGSPTAMGGGGQPATFASLATPGTLPSPFGSGTQTGGFGSMTGSGGFGGGFSGGGTTPFGAPRR